MMQQQVEEKKTAALEPAFEELQECLADYFNYLPDKVPGEPLIIIDPQSRIFPLVPRVAWNLRMWMHLVL